MPRKKMTQDTTYGTFSTSYRPDKVFMKKTRLSGDYFEVFSGRFVWDMVYAYTGKNEGDVTQTIIKQLARDLTAAGQVEMSM